jgi:hypothetical protein
LFFSTPQKRIQTAPTRSIRYFELLDTQTTPSLDVPASKPQLLPILPDPWTSDEMIMERSKPVSSTSNIAPMRFQKLFVNIN